MLGPASTSELVLAALLQTLNFFRSAVELLCLLHDMTHPLQHHAGLFIPSLALGAAWGRIVGMLVRYMVGHHAISLPAYAVSCLTALPLCTHS